jgi:hypothetical protein
MSSVNSFNSLLPNYKQTYSGEKKMAQPKLGSGERFKHLKNMLAKKPGITNPGALAAKIGMEKYGKKKFEHMAQVGKHRHNK